MLQLYLCMLSVSQSVPLPVVCACAHFYEAIINSSLSIFLISVFAAVLADRNRSGSQLFFVHVAFFLTHPLFLYRCHMGIFDPISVNPD